MSINRQESQDHLNKMSHDIELLFNEDSTVTVCIRPVRDRKIQPHAHAIIWNDQLRMGDSNIEAG